jgi:two-component system sensor histidine kinase SenX3
VSNLLDNALKYSPEGASCELSARTLGDRVEFSVRDRGIGISTDQLERVFDRFYQVDSSRTRNYTGVGLGLSLVKDLVGHLGGTVVVSSRPGAGSTFIVTLPVRYPGRYLEPAPEPDVNEESPAIATRP